MKGQVVESGIVGEPMRLRTLCSPALNPRLCLRVHVEVLGLGFEV